MKFTTPFMILFSSLSPLGISVTQAIPLAIRDVYAPPIITPAEHDIWQIGQNKTVTWNTTSPAPPANITNPSGKVLLRKGTRTLLNLVLADGFNISSGAVNVTVPDVDPGDDYRVVLFGDSGNWSPVFTIKT